MSLVISIRHNCFGINFIRTFQLVECFIQTIHLLPIIIQEFIDAPHSSKYSIHFVTFIHVHLVSSDLTILELVSSIYFNLSNISSKQFVYLHLSSKKFINVIFIQIFIYFVIFIHVHVEKISHVILTWHGDIFKIFFPHHQNIPNIFIPTHKLTLTLTCSLRSIVDLISCRNTLNCTIINIFNPLMSPLACLCMLFWFHFLTSSSSRNIGKYTSSFISPSIFLVNIIISLVI